MTHGDDRATTSGTVFDAPGARLRQLKLALTERRLALFHDSALEAEFVEDQRDSNARLARSGLLMAFSLNAVFLLMDHLWLGQHYSDHLQKLYWYFVLPVLVAAFVFTGFASLRRWTAEITISALVITGIAFAWTGYNVVIQPDRPPYAFEACVIYLAFVYFFSGARLLPAIAVSCGMLLIYLVSLTLSPITGATTLYCMFFMVAISGVGLIGRYLLDSATRRDYLSRLLAQELAERDPLTGLYNRRVFGERFQSLLMKATKEAVPLSVVLIDIDRFKSVNDTAGHAFGDLILQETGVALASSCRQSEDCAARLGGDEFCAIWIDLEPAAAYAAAENLLREAETRYRASIEASTERRVQGAISASIGLVTIVPNEARDTVQSLLQRADEALYAAKHAGRGRVICT